MQTQKQKTSSTFPSVAFAVLLAVAAVIIGGCGSNAKDNKGGGPFVVGFIYVGPKDDYGYNQAHAEGAAAVKKMDGVKVLEMERVAETVDAQKAMKRMIEQDGAKVIFPTSYGYFKPHVLTVAKDYPNVTFLHCGGTYEDGMPSNVGTFFGFIDECQYLSGIVAGHMTKSKKLGFVAAKPIAQVLWNINAFTLGARSVNPDVTCIVIFTGDWSMPKQEADATNSLIDQGADVITCHVDCPKVVIETAEKRGIMTCGYHTSQAVLAPKGYLTGAEWNWQKIYTDYVADLKAGKKLQKHSVRGGLKDGYLKTSDYGPMVTPEAKKDADDAKAKLVAGTFVIFKGPIKDNKGNEVVPKGKEIAQTDKEMDNMNYLVEGVKGKM